MPRQVRRPPSRSASTSGNASHATPTGSGNECATVRAVPIRRDRRNGSGNVAGNVPQRPAMPSARFADRCGQSSATPRHAVRPRRTCCGKGQPCWRSYAAPVASRGNRWRQRRNRPPSRSASTSGNVAGNAAATPRRAMQSAAAPVGAPTGSTVRATVTGNAATLADRNAQPLAATVRRSCAVMCRRATVRPCRPAILRQPPTGAGNRPAPRSTVRQSSARSGYECAAIRRQERIMRRQRPAMPPARRTCRGKV